MSALRGIADLGALEKLPVIVRADLNVPIDEDGAVIDDARIIAAGATVKALMDAGAYVIVLAHLGRPGGQPVMGTTLLPVAERLSRAVGALVAHAPDVVGPLAKAAILNLRPGDAVLLGNVRFEAGEEADDDAFAARLAAPGRAFVFDAFGAAHRRHASTVGIARHLPTCAGFVVQHEVAALESLRDSGALDGAVVVAGGAKAAEKLPALARLAERAQAILVGGVVAHVLLAATGEAELGASIVDRSALDAAREVVAVAARSGCDLVLPTDVIATDGLTTDARIRVEGARTVPEGAIALDIGPETRAAFAERIATAGIVVWDGPPGAFEMEPFAEGTRAVATAMASASGTTVVGGGDTGSALRGFGLAGEMEYLSTGGAALLHLLAGLPLPALEGLR